MTFSRSLRTATVLIIGLLFSTSTLAVLPTSRELGRELFERQWKSKNPQLGSDGLGPMFNAKSCVACHHQGGVGGGGDTKFNAQAIGIERLDFSAGNGAANELVPVGVKQRMLAGFYPGFSQTQGAILNTVPLPHNSQSPDYKMIRWRILQSASAVPSQDGGAENPSDLRLRSHASVDYRSTDGSFTMVLRARLFDRNTTSLFGSGLIDSITEDEIRDQARKQRQHPEISGRPSVLRDGTLGRFGWRANVNRLVQFVDRACANELSLETRRRPQTSDPTRPQYRNVSYDIDDRQVEQMSEFIAHLPSPIQELPTNPNELANVRRGGYAFGAVGCAICHVPDVGSATGIYSDLLLHDMGPDLYDFDAAEPYVVRQRLSTEPRPKEGSIRTGYYGAATSISSGSSGFAASNTFISRRGSTLTEDFVTLRVGDELGRKRIATIGGTQVTAEFRNEFGIKRRLQPSSTTQEWRTAPLWGAGDSAPYMHDGRAETLLEAIALHDGESAGSRDRFLNLSLVDRHAVIAFLETLVAPPGARKVTLSR